MPGGVRGADSVLLRPEEQSIRPMAAPLPSHPYPIGTQCRLRYGDLQVATLTAQEPWLRSDLIEIVDSLLLPSSVTLRNRRTSESAVFSGGTFGALFEVVPVEELLSPIYLVGSSDIENILNTTRNNRPVTAVKPKTDFYALLDLADDAFAALYALNEELL